MLKIILGAAALLAGMALPGRAQQWGASASTPVPSRAEAAAASARAPAASDRPRAEAPADVVITESHIARLRATLKLSPAQLAYWAPVEAALSQLARQQARGEAAGFSQRFTDRSAAVAMTATQLRRLKAVAMPLIQSLDDNQKRDAIIFARNLGLQQLVAAF